VCVCVCVVVLVRVARHKKGVNTEEMKRYVAWTMEQHHQQQLGERINVIFDFTDAGLLNMACTCIVVSQSVTDVMTNVFPVFSDN